MRTLRRIAKDIGWWLHDAWAEIRESRRVRRLTLAERQEAWDRTDAELREVYGEGLDPERRPQ